MLLIRTSAFRHAKKAVDHDLGITLDLAILNILQLEILLLVLLHLMYKSLTNSWHYCHSDIRACYSPSRVHCGNCHISLPSLSYWCTALGTIPQWSPSPLTQIRPLPLTSRDNAGSFTPHTLHSPFIIVIVLPRSSFTMASISSWSLFSVHFCTLFKCPAYPQSFLSVAAMPQKNHWALK